MALAGHRVWPAARFVKTTPDLMPDGAARAAPADQAALRVAQFR
ncbi:unnamed protein product [Acidocella sp. C78]|nr:unnamed protein product [Acidocella sp. C78]